MFRNTALLVVAFAALPFSREAAAQALTPTPAVGNTVTFTFPAPTHARATLTVNADDVGGAPVIFKVQVGKVMHTFTRATPADARTIEVPADPRTFIRFGVQKLGAAPLDALALILPDSRPLLSSDACGTWDLASSGGSATATCVARERHCPTFSRPSADRRLTESQCGSRSVKFCVPDYQVDVIGQRGRKVRLSVDGDPGQWLPLKGPSSVRHLKLPSGGRCSGITVESGSDHVFIAAAPGQQLQIRLAETGAIAADDAPPRVSRQASASAE
jgi:hypothetical protein